MIFVILYSRSNDAVGLQIDIILIQSHRMQKGMMRLKAVSGQKGTVHAVQNRQSTVRTLHDVGLDIQ